MKKLMMQLVLSAAIGVWSTLAAAAGMGVMVENPWVREAPPTAMALGGFMVLHNQSDKAVVLVGATSPVAGEVQLHRTVMEGGMAKMVRQDAIEIPAGGAVTFQPGSFHLMLMQPKRAVKAGDKVEITLQFKDGSTMPATFEVRAGMGGTDMEHGKDMGGMKM